MIKVDHKQVRMQHRIEDWIQSSSTTDHRQRSTRHRSIASDKIVFLRQFVDSFKSKPE